MQSENRLFDDFAKLLNGVAGTVAGAGREAEGQMRERLKGLFGGADFVSRDEFEAVKAMAAAARDEAEALKARLNALEGRSHEANAPTSDTPPPADGA
jgi:BMFP domain-containing protein YqiC